MTRRFVTALVALAGEMFAGWIDVHATEEVPILLIVIGLSCLLSLAVPRGAWLRPPITALGVLFVNWTPALVNAAPNPHFPRTIGSYALLGPVMVIAASIGVAMGLALRKVVTGNYSRV